MDMEQSQKFAKKMRFVTVFLLAENLDRKPSRKNGGDWPRLPINRDSGRWQLYSNVVLMLLLSKWNYIHTFLPYVFLSVATNSI
jgi:hypothetical protein